MEWKKEWKPAALLLLGFLIAFHLPVGIPRFDNAMLEALHLVKWYAEEHVLLCLVPAFFIAGAIGIFISQASVMKYLGADAHKGIAYGVASVSGTVLAVCSCTVLPLFGGIYRMGAGLGPATAFLYSGPAINVLAIILTARVLGTDIGIARAVGAILFSVIIGLCMHFIYRREEQDKAAAQRIAASPETGRPLWQNAAYFASMVGILIFANWGAPAQAEGFWQAVFSWKWAITAACGAAFGVMLVRWFAMPWWKVALAAAPVAVLALLFPGRPVYAFTAGAAGLAVITLTTRGEMEQWFETSWGFAKQILPLLFFGVLAAGALLGRPGHEGLIPSEWVEWAVGGNSIRANLLAAVVGAFMYFATLTEVPILQGLIGAGMGKGPALALLLAGPALSLPNMLVIRSIMGTKKTMVYIALVVAMSALAGILFGVWSG